MHCMIVKLVWNIVRLFLAGVTHQLQVWHRWQQWQTWNNRPNLKCDYELDCDNRSKTFDFYHITLWQVFQQWQVWHIKNMSLQCSICSQSFAVPSEVNRHHANVHNLGQTQRKLYKCDMCPYTTFDVFLRNQHKIDAHHREKLTKPNLNLYYVNNKPDYWKVKWMKA